jgi:hypothetical protein
MGETKPAEESGAKVVTMPRGKAVGVALGEAPLRGRPG